MIMKYQLLVTDLEFGSGKEVLIFPLIFREGLEEILFGGPDFLIFRQVLAVLLEIHIQWVLCHALIHDRVIHVEHCFGWKFRYQ